MTDQGRKIFNMILALLVSMGAWVFVVYNYEPMTDVTYNDVPITYTGLVTLANRGYAVDEASYEAVDVRLEQRRVETGNITAEDISVTADVSNLSTGENTVTLSVSGPDGTSVDDISVKTVTVDIESADSEDMEIMVEYSDQPDDDAVPVIEDMSAEYATVIATEDRLDSIDRIAAVIDPEDLGEKAKPLTVQPVALDKDGNKVLNVIIEPETVSFKAASGHTKEVTLNVPVKDESDDDYERAYSATETLIIKGTDSALARVAAINASEIDITYIYEDTEIPVEIELPEGIQLATGNKAPVLTVKVTQKPDTEEE